MKVSITGYSSAHQSAIRRILERIGWEEQYIAAAERNVEAFSNDSRLHSVFLATINSSVVGFIFARFHEWNQLAQIEGLAVDPSYHRQGVASELVKNAEAFAKARGARGIYVDTPTLNQRGRSFYEAIGYSYGYEMPRYYEDNLDGVTYQKFFNNV